MLFTLNAEEMTKSKDLIQGKCKVNSGTLVVLYNSSATHSFISHECVDRLRLSMSKLPYVLIVSTTTDKIVKTNRVFLKCHFQIDGRSFIVDFNMSSFVWTGFNLGYGLAFG